TCGPTGPRSARRRWTNDNSGSLRPTAATSNSRAARTRRCDLSFAGALPVGTLVLLVRSLAGWTSTRFGGWLPIRRSGGRLLGTGALDSGWPLRGLLSVGLLGPLRRTVDPCLRTPSTLRPATLRAPSPLRTPSTLRPATLRTPSTLRPTLLTVLDPRLGTVLRPRFW